MLAITPILHEIPTLPLQVMLAPRERDLNSHRNRLERFCRNLRCAENLWRAFATARLHM